MQKKFYDQTSKKCEKENYFRSLSKEKNIMAKMEKPEILVVENKKVDFEK